MPRDCSLGCLSVMLLSTLRCAGDELLAWWMTGYCEVGEKLSHEVQFVISWADHDMSHIIRLLSTYHHISPRCPEAFTPQTWFFLLHSRKIASSLFRGIFSKIGLFSCNSLLQKSTPESRTVFQIFQSGSVPSARYALFFCLLFRLLVENMQEVKRGWMGGWEKRGKYRSLLHGTLEPEWWMSCPWWC